MALRYVPNNTSRWITLAGTETARGVPATPDFRLRGDLAIRRTQEVRRAPEATGTRDRLVTPNLGRPDFTGTYSEQLTYESLSQHLRYWIEAGDPAVGDSAAGTEAFTRAFIPGVALDSMTLQYGHPGMGDVSPGVIHNEGNIAWDFDDDDSVWKFSSTLLPTGKAPLPGTIERVATGATATTITHAGTAMTVNGYAGAWLTIYGGTGYGQQRQIVSNTATTVTVSAPFSPTPAAGTRFRIEGLFEAGIPNATGEVKIAMPGTKVFVDALGLPIGSTQIRERMISGNLTVTNALAAKWFAENEDAPSGKVDEGDRIISGQLQMEFDRRDEYEQWRTLTDVAIRFEKEGPAIDATKNSRYLARVDVARALWTDYTPATRQNNITATFAFDAYVPASDPILEITTVTPQAALY